MGFTNNLEEKIKSITATGCYHTIRGAYSFLKNESGNYEVVYNHFIYGNKSYYDTTSGDYLIAKNEKIILNANELESNVCEKIYVALKKQYVDVIDI